MNTADMADEIARLRKERDELAAQLSEMASLADSLTFASSEDEADGIVQKIAGLVHDEGGSLARRDARMKAEALEVFVAEALAERKTFFFDSELMDAAKQYRKQAEGES